MKLLVDLRLKHADIGIRRFFFSWKWVFSIWILVLIDENTYIGFTYVEIDVCAEYFDLLRRKIRIV